MLKKEAIEFLRNKNGYLPFPNLFDIFDEKEEIPDYIINYDPNQKPKTEFELVKLLLDII